MEFCERDGHLVCCKHGVEICGRCYVAYCFSAHDSSGEEGLGEEDSNDGNLNVPKREATFFARINNDKQNDKEEVATKQAYVPCFPKRKPLPQYRKDGTLIVPPISVFRPCIPTITPQSLFPLRHIKEYPRYVHQSSEGDDFLIYTDGACLNNGQANPAAGWGFVFRDPEPGAPRLGRVYGRLEKEGPSDSGEEYKQTSNRAELRAIIAAFQFRAWPFEGYKRLVIATDSAYVTRGATQWVRTWVRNDWKTNKGTAVKNRDLWEELMREIHGYHELGMQVKFWRIPREWNSVADQAAKEGARMKQGKPFGKVYGVLL